MSVALPTRRCRRPGWLAKTLAPQAGRPDSDRASALRAALTQLTDFKPCLAGPGEAHPCETYHA